MTNPELSEPTSPTYPGNQDLLEDALSWFAGRSEQPPAQEPSVPDEDEAGSEPTEPAAAALATDGEGDAAEAETDVEAQPPVLGEDGQAGAAPLLDAGEGSATDDAAGRHSSDQLLVDSEGEEPGPGAAVGSAEAVEEPAEAVVIEETPAAVAEDVPPIDAIDSEAGEAPQAEPAASLFREDAAPAAAAGAAGLAAFAATSAGGQPVIAEDEASLKRAEEREERDRQLGKVQPLSAAPAPTPYSLPSTYKFLPSFGLLLLRLVTAGIIGIRAIMHALNIGALEKLWADLTVLSSQASVVAWIQTGVEAVVAVLLVIGLGTRIAGALLSLLSISLLAFMMWGAANPFQPGVVGFTGEVEVLLAAVGILFLTTGGGRAAIDGTIHKGRIATKNDKLVA